MRCRDLPILEIARGSITSLDTEALFEHCRQCPRCRENLTILIHLREIYSDSLPRAEKASPLTFLKGRRWLPIAAAVLLGLAILPLRDRGGISTESPYQVEENLPFPIQTLSAPEQSPAHHEAIEAFQKGDYERAEKLLSLLPPTPETLFIRALSLQRAARHRESVPVLNLLLDQRSPWHEKALWLRADAYFVLGKTAEAATDIRQIIAEGGPLQAQAQQKLRERALE